MKLGDRAIYEQPATSEHWLADERARRDAESAIARDVPDPADYAYHAPLWMVEALIAAYPATDLSNRGCLRVSHEAAAKLRPYGIVEARGVHLSVFGTRVRNALVQDGVQ